MCGRVVFRTTNTCQPGSSLRRGVCGDRDGPGTNTADNPFFEDWLFRCGSQLCPCRQDRRRHFCDLSSNAQCARNVLAKLLLSLAVRSEWLLAHFKDVPSDVLAPGCASGLLEAARADDMLYPRRRPGKPWKQLTTEQKLWSIFDLMQWILWPLWSDAGAYDRVLQGDFSFLREVHCFGGGLVFTHTCEYLEELQRREVCFPDFEHQDWEVVPGKNSNHFLDLCMAVGQRSSKGRRPTFEEVATAVNEDLAMTPITPAQASAMACKFMQIVASVFTGKDLGRQRASASSTAGESKGIKRRLG